MDRRLAWIACAPLALHGCGPAADDRGGRGDAPARRQVATLEAADAILASVQTLLRDERRDQGLGVLASAVETYPRDRELRRAYAELLTGAGRHAEALEQRERALEIGPATHGLLFDAGASAAFVEDWALAAERFAAAAEADPSHAESALRHGLALRELGRDDGAIAELRRAARLDPTSAIAWGSLAQTLLDRGDGAGAVAPASRARSLEPGEIAWRVLEARAVRAAGDPDAALLLLSALDGEDRASRGVRETIASLCDQLQRPAIAAGLYAEAARSAGTDPALWLEAARWQRRAGDPGAAERSARTAAMLGSDAARALLRELNTDAGGGPE